MGGRSLGKNLYSFAHCTVICTRLACACTHSNLHTVLAHLCRVGFNKVNKTLQQSSSAIKKGKNCSQFFRRCLLLQGISIESGPDDHLQYNLIDRGEAWALTVYSLQFHSTAKKAGWALKW